jgi:ABC-type Mn2+/Zn2+ transport system permease subunit
VLAWLLDPFTSSFMQRALVACVAVGLAAPCIGSWALARRLVYLTDAMSHALLLGVAGAVLTGASLMLGGLVAAVAMAMLVAVLVLRARVAEDGAIGVVGQGMFALGVVGVSVAGDPRALAHVLFGNPLTVTAAENVGQVATAVLVVLGAWMFGPLLGVTTFDSAHARTVGVRVGVVDSALLVVVAVVVVTGLTSVGALMIVTLMTAPAVAARLITTTVHRAVPVAAALGAGAGVLGLLLSYHLAVPTGPVVSVVAVAQVAAAASWVACRELVERRGGGAPQRRAGAAPMTVTVTP